MADPDPGPAISIPEKAVLVQPEKPREPEDIWDDRMKMGGAIAIAVLIIGVMTFLIIIGEGTNPVMGAFVLALDRVIRYFFSTGNGG